MTMESMDHNSIGHITWQLKLLTKHAGNPDEGPAAKSEMNCDLIEHLLLSIVRCKKYDAVIQHGLQCLQTFGYRPRICKCIILALCHTARYQECYLFLEQWGQRDPKNPTMLACRLRVEGFLIAVGSGLDPKLILGDLEDALGLLPTISGSMFQDNEKKLSDLSASASSSLTNISRAFTLPEYSEVSSNWSTSKSSSPSPSLTKSSYSLISQHYLHHPYLNKLHKQVTSSPDVSKVLVDKLEGVKIRCFSDVDAVVRGTDHRWAFAINSKEAMRTVSLLNDENRDNFYITGAHFYHAENRTINLIEIHPTNNVPHLQVLNTFVPADLLRGLGGWPSCFTYKIEVRFKGFSSRKYAQTIVFDFKKESKIAKHISADMQIPSPSMLPIGSGSSTRSTPTPVSASAIVPYKDLDCSPSTSGSLFGLPGPNPVKSEWHKNSGTTLLHRSNYVSAQDRIINCEMQFLQTHLRQNSMVQTMKLTKSYIMEKKFGNEMKLADEGEMFLVMEIGSPSLRDTIFGKLVYKYCSCVLITNTASPAHSYTCKVKEKMQEKWVITVDFNQVLELGLRLDQSFQFKIEFILDISHFAELTRILGAIGDIELQILFPDVTRRINSALDTFDGTLQEGLFSLNPRQVDAFNVITKLPLSMKYVPPILLMGLPGSGKTYTLIESVKKILMSQPASRLLICTQSNGAANKLLETFDEWIKSGLKVKMIRVYDYEHHSSEDLPSVAKRYCTFGLDFNLRLPLKEEIQQSNIIVTTVNTTPILSKMTLLDLGKYYFSHIIIDEAGHQLEVDLISPLFLANPSTRIIISGDQNSYNPLSSVSSNILERLNLHYPDGHLCKIILTENYRSHPDILTFVSDNFSPVKLRCCTSVQSSHPKYFPLTYFAVKGGEAKSRSSFYNISEVLEISKFAQNLVSSWPAQWGRHQEPNAIAVFTNYEDQIVHLRNQLKSVGLGFVTVEGIWNLKANWFRVVILSTVRCYDSNSAVVDDSGFFNNDRLIYNAMTRTQSLFAVFGDPSLCAFGLSSDKWKAFISAAALGEINLVTKPEPNYFQSAAKRLAGEESSSTFQLWPQGPPPGLTKIAQPQAICRPTPASLARPLSFSSISSSTSDRSEEFAMAKFMESVRDNAFMDSIQSKLGESLLAQLNGRGNIQDGQKMAMVNGYFTPPPRPSSTNSNGNHRVNSLPPRLMKEKNNRSRNRKSGNEAKKSNAGGSANGHGNSNGRRNEATNKKANSGANLNEMILESVANKLDNMTLKSEKTTTPPTSTPQDKDTDKESPKSSDDWVEVKKTKRSKRGKGKNANESSPAKASTSASTAPTPTPDDKIKCLTNMGYQRRPAVKALQRAENDLSKAIEYLVSGSTPTKRKQAAGTNNN